MRNPLTSDDTYRPEERIADLKAEVKRLTAKAADWQEVAKNENERRKAAEARVAELEAALGEIAALEPEFNATGWRAVRWARAALAAARVRAAIGDDT